MSEMSREDLLNLLAKSNPRTRRTVMRVVEGKVAQDDIAFVQEQLSFVDRTSRSETSISSASASVARAMCWARSSGSSHSAPAAQPTPARSRGVRTSVVAVT